MYDPEVHSIIDLEKETQILIRCFFLLQNVKELGFSEKKAYTFLCDGDI